MSSKFWSKKGNTGVHTCLARPTISEELFGKTYFISVIILLRNNTKRIIKELNQFHLMYIKINY